MKKILAIMLLPVLFSFIHFSTYKLKGKVVDENGNAIIAASVSLKAGNYNTFTNKNGSFELNVNGTEMLIVNAVGYETKKVAIRNRTQLVIQLSTSKRELNELAAAEVQDYDKEFKKSMAPVGANYSRKLPTRIAYGFGNVPVLDREGYDGIDENVFQKATDQPLSTFSIDVDAASYSNVRRFLKGGNLPPAGAVRIEEMINYFSYAHPQPKNGKPFSINTELAACPWNKNHQLLMIGLQAKKIETKNLPASNLVFLIDVSGSMSDANKLPLVKSSLKLLVDQLREEDKVALVVYAGNAGLVLPSTSGEEKTKIKSAIDNLEAGGSTAGGAGIQLAYKTAMENFIQRGNNRVILCTDGDFNVGASSDDELIRMIEQKRTTGIYLTVLGYGMGNYQDAKMQKLADKGNGNHHYIDEINEAKKVLVNEFGGTLFTIAKDVKLQVEFNPALVQGYRLIGYENRMMAKEDFNDDKKDAGEMGSGHTVTALYEIIPVGVKATELRGVDSLKFSSNHKPVLAFGNEIVNVKMRYKAPEQNKSEVFELAVRNEIKPASSNMQFAAAVAEFGMLLRNSPLKAHSSYGNVLNMASQGEEKDEYRKEFIELVKLAEKLSGRKELAIEE